MKTVFTFIMITFVLSTLLYLGGVTNENELSATRFIINLLSGHDVSFSYLWVALAGFGVIVLGVAAVNSATGGNASVATTSGIYWFILWAISLVGDFVAVVSKAGATCFDVNTGALICSGMNYVAYYIIWIFGGLVAVGFMFALFDLLTGND